MKNRKGFTLVELLAVIVVLAIIMIIAIPNVLNSMDTAKKNSLVIEARKAINYAMQKQQEASLNGASISCCTLSDLGMDSGGKYEGRVVISNNTYTVYMWEGQYGINGKTSSELDPSMTFATSNTNLTLTCAADTCKTTTSS